MQKVLVKAVAALCLLPGTVWAQVPSDAERYYGWGHMMGWGGGWSGMIFGPFVYDPCSRSPSCHRDCSSALARWPMAWDISATPIATYPDATRYSQGALCAWRDR